MSGLLQGYDDFFDLDMVLTVPEIVSTSTTGNAKTSPSPAMIAGQERAHMISEMPTVSAPSGQDCTVCMERFEHSSTGKELLVCGHVYHEGCITTWLSLHDSCPLCRSKVFSGAGR